MIDTKIDQKYEKKYLKYKKKYADLQSRMAMNTITGGSEHKPDVHETDQKEQQEEGNVHIAFNKSLHEQNKNVENVKNVKKDYQKERYNQLLKQLSHADTDHVTKGKYFVILYGPPASGKSLIRENILLTINKRENENTDNIKTSFIDTQIDEIAYNVISTEKDITKICQQIKLSKDSNDCNKGLENNENITVRDQLQCLKKNIIGNSELSSDLINCSFNIYDQGRDNSLSELKIYYGLYMLKNIFFEISTYSEYLDKIIDTALGNKYTVMILYPFTDNIDILGKRALKRGADEGRVLHKCKPEKGYDASIDTKAQGCIKGYRKLKAMYINNNNVEFYTYLNDYDPDNENKSQNDTYPGNKKESQNDSNLPILKQNTALEKDKDIILPYNDCSISAGVEK